MEGGQVEIALPPKRLECPAMLLRGGFDVAQDGADVNRLAVITAVIFAELLHVENFTQRRRDAKKIVQLAFFGSG